MARGGPLTNGYRGRRRTPEDTCENIEGEVRGTACAENSDDELVDVSVRRDEKHLLLRGGSVAKLEIERARLGR